MNITQGIAKDIAHVLECVNAMNYDIALTKHSLALLSIDLEITDRDTVPIGKVVYDDDLEAFVFVPNK